MQGQEPVPALAGDRQGDGGRAHPRGNRAPGAGVDRQTLCD